MNAHVLLNLVGEKISNLVGEKISNARPVEHCVTFLQRV